MIRLALLLGAATVCALSLTTPAFAQTAGAAPSPFSFSLGAATDYRSKGLSKSDDEGYAFATADWKSGQFYAGAAVATVDIPIGATWETDAKIGVRPKLAGWDLDFTLFYRAFQDARPGTDDDYIEYRAQASRNFGKFNIRLLTWETPDNVGPPKASNWTEGRLIWKASPHIRASVALGRHDQENGPTYNAWNAGAGIDIAPKLELDLRWYDTDGHEFGDRYDGEAVAALIARF